jgi:RND family efflux transporter MFP subunit
MNRRYYLLLLTTLLGFLITLTNCKPPTKAQSATEKTTAATISIVEVKDITIYRELSGVLVPKNEVNVIPKAAGEVRSVVAEVGDKVFNGTPLAYIEDTDYKLGLDQAKAAKKLAEASLNQSERDLERQSVLKTEGAISEQTFEQISTGVEVAKAQLEQASVGVAMAQRQVDNTVITSPINGYVAERTIQSGQMASPQMPVFRIVDSDTLELTISVNIEDLQEIKVNDKVTVRINGLIDKEFVGKIAALPVAAESRSNQFNVKVFLPNTNKEILPGTIGYVNLPIQNLKAAIALPADVVLKRINGNFIMKYVNGKAVEVEVTTGKSWGDSVEIIKGLALNDTVIAKGANYLKDGDLVNIKETEVNP